MTSNFYETLFFVMMSICHVFYK